MKHVSPFALPVLRTTLAHRSASQSSYLQRLPELSKQNARLQAQVAALAARVDQAATAPVVSK